MVDRLHRRELADRFLSNLGEIPVVRQGAGHDLQLLGLRIHPKAVVDALSIVPGDDLRIVVAVSAAGQAQVVFVVDIAVAHHRLVLLRENEILSVRRIEAAIIAGEESVVLDIPICEGPFHFAVLRAVPEDLAAAVIALDQLAVAVDGIELIPLERIVPHARVHDDPFLTVVRFVRGDLVGGEDLESILREGRILSQIEPGVGVRLRTGVEAARHLAAAVVDVYVVTVDELELDHAGIAVLADIHLDQTVVGRTVCRLCVHQNQLFVPGISARLRDLVNIAQVFARRGFQIVLIEFPRPFESPEVDLRFGHQEEVIEEVHVFHLALDLFCGSLSGIRGVVGRHQRRAGSGGVGGARFVIVGVVANDAVAFAVQAEGILLRRSIVFKLQLCVVVGFAPPRRKPFAAGVSSLVPAPGGGPSDVLRHEHAERDVLCVVWFHIESSGLP